MQIFQYKLQGIAIMFENLTENIAIHYKSAIQKTQGKKRVFHKPDEELKTVQKMINKVFQLYLPRADYLYTGYKKCRVIDLINVHKNSRNAVVLDVKNFYGSVSKERVFKFLTDICQLNKNTAEIILKLITYKDTLPLGVPTSNIVSFWACKSVFDKIYNYCQDLGYNMTLYADDMVISGNIQNPVTVISTVQKELLKAGLKLNYRKIRIYGKRKRIMNIHINSKGRLSVDYKLRRSINYLKAKPILSEQEKLVLQGKLNYARQIERRT